jgi:demethylmenaquinone methyltransferase/2-methoxy-6-polyprenyl-1,4-benzoquinol methylase
VALRSTISTPAGKRRYVRRLFATIADRYDFITRFLSYGQDQRWKRRVLALAQVRPGDRVLDLAAGTGDLALGAAATARRVVALDVTHRMLQLARARAAAMHGGAQRRCHFVTGDMGALPFAAGDVDVVTTGYGLRNVPVLTDAIREVHRVLAPGGRLVSLDFNRPGNPIVRQAYWTYLTIVGSGLGLVLHGDPNTYRYIPESIRLYPGAEAVGQLLRAEGFSDVQVIPVLFGFMAIHVAVKRAAV